MSTIKLREATPADAAALGALHVASWHETYAGLIPDAMLAGLSAEARTAMWTKILGDPDVFGGTVVFVAEDGGRIVGFGSCGQQRDKTLADDVNGDSLLLAPAMLSLADGSHRTAGRSRHSSSCHATGQQAGDDFLP